MDSVSFIEAKDFIVKFKSYLEYLSVSLTDTSSKLIYKFLISEYKDGLYNHSLQSMLKQSQSFYEALDEDIDVQHKREIAKKKLEKLNNAKKTFFKYIGVARKV